MEQNGQSVRLDNKSIAKMAIAIAYAMQLRAEGREEIGPLTRKVLEVLDTLDELPHFASYTR